MSDTGEALSNPETLNRIAKAARDGWGDGQQLIVVKVDGGKKEDGFAKFKDVIFVAVVLAMGGFTWSNSISQASINATLKTTVENLQSTVAELTREIKELSTRIKP